MSSVGACLARERLAAGLTQEEAAESLGIGNEAVSRMERGAAMPTLERLYDFAKLYGCRMDRLLMESSDREADQAAVIFDQLTGLGHGDRQLVVSIMAELVSHLRKAQNDKRKR